MKISIVIVLLSSILANGRLTINEARNLTAEKKMTGIIVIGDSTVDTGNNNYLPLSIFRANFPPYGKNFFGGIPTGRFCNGRLAPDFLGEYFNLGKFVPPYLQLKSKGIIDKQPFASYASAGTGFDDCTAVGAFPFPQEMKWFNQYVQDLSAIVGNGTAKKTINNAICLFSIGTNDWIRNYFIPGNPLCIRSLQYTVDEFVDLLVPVFKQSIKVLHAGGCRRFIIYSVAPAGCLPFSKTIAAGSFTGKCVDRYNQAVIKHNSKIQQALLSLKRKLDIKTTYVDLYRLLVDAVYNPNKYGFTEGSRGCCGTGTFEGAILCNPLTPICSNVSKYLFWDAVHPTENFYKILADQTMEALSYDFFM